MLAGGPHPVLLGRSNATSSPRHSSRSSYSYEPVFGPIYHEPVYNPDPRVNAFGGARWRYNERRSSSASSHRSHHLSRGSSAGDCLVMPQIHEPHQKVHGRMVARADEAARVAHLHQRGPFGARVPGRTYGVRARDKGQPFHERMVGSLVYAWPVEEPPPPRTRVAHKLDKLLHRCYHEQARMARSGGT